MLRPPSATYSPTAASLPASLKFPSASQPAGILVADALPLFLQGLLHVLAQAFTDCPLHEVGSPDELLPAVSHHRPALVLLAANLVRTSEELLELLREVRQQHPATRLLLFLEPAVGPGLAGQHALHRQVSGLLTRSASPAQVCEAVQATLRGEQPRLPLLAGENGRRREATSFTPRQLEILHLIAADCSNEEIADALCTSVRTVEYHRSQMLHRVGSRTTLGLVLYAQRQGLLPLPGSGLSGPPRLTTRP